MPLLGAKPTPVCLPDFVKLLAVVEIQLRHAVIVGDEQIGMPGAAQIGRRGRQRPAAAVDAHLAR